MHGIVHRTLNEYVVEKTDEDSWDAVCERAGVESQLYLLVTHYPDEEVQQVLDTLAEMSGYDRRLLERDFGRRLGPELLDTFRAHLRDDWDLETLLAELESVIAEVEDKKEETTVPEITVELENSTATITYRSDRAYCGLAHGVLESIVGEFDEAATTAKTACVDDGADRCRFTVEWET